MFEITIWLSPGWAPGEFGTDVDGGICPQLGW